MTDAIRPLIAGNWKMNGLKSSFAEFDAMLAGAGDVAGKADLLVCPPATLVGAFADKARQAGVAFDGQFVITDNVQQAIVDMAEQRHCDLIVMASHGRHGLDALIHGSLTKSVLAHSQVPLLVLH